MLFPPAGGRSEVTDSEDDEAGFEDAMEAFARHGEDEISGGTQGGDDLAAGRRFDVRVGMFRLQEALRAPAADEDGNAVYALAPAALAGGDRWTTAPLRALRRIRAEEEVVYDTDENDVDLAPYPPSQPRRGQGRGRGRGRGRARSRGLSADERKSVVAALRRKGPLYRGRGGGARFKRAQQLTAVDEERLIQKRDYCGPFNDARRITQSGDIFSVSFYGRTMNERDAAQHMCAVRVPAYTRHHPTLLAAARSAAFYVCFIGQLTLFLGTESANDSEKWYSESAVSDGLVRPGHLPHRTLVRINADVQRDLVSGAWLPAHLLSGNRNDILAGGVPTLRKYLWKWIAGSNQTAATVRIVMLQLPSYKTYA